MGDERQVQPRPLAARQVGDRDKGLFLAKAEGAEPGAHSLRQGIRHQLGEMVVGRGLGPHFLDLVLGEEAASELGGLGDLARERGKTAGQQTGQGGLAVAVGADQRHPLIWIEPQIELRQHRFARNISGADPVERDQWRAQLWRVGKTDLWRRLGGGEGNRLEPGQCLEPALRLARL